MRKWRLISYGVTVASCDWLGNRPPEIPWRSRRTKAAAYRRRASKVWGGCVSPPHYGVTVASCNWLGNRALGPFMETPSAHKLCNQCNFDRSVPGAYRPLSFLRMPDPCRNVRKRDFDEVMRAVEAIEEDPTKQSALYKEHGFNKHIFAWHPK